MITRWIALCTCCVAAPLSAQRGVFVTAGRVTAGTPNESSWRVTVQRDIVGPVGADIAFQVLPGARPGQGELYGFGGDFTVFADARRIPTLFVGAAAGIGVADQKSLWYGGSVGLRMPIVVLGPVRLMAEGRWRNLTVEGRDGLEFGVAIGYRAPRATTQPGQRESAGLWVPRSTAERLRAAGIPEAKANLLDNIVSTALEEMGQPYLWGGTGDGAGGFDCSGLIQYAYSRYGIRLPRTSASQATAGVAIRRDLESLLPGDILTFGDGGDVTHVGMYVGEGRFIHSASRGVRVSRLAEDDADGRWWLRRWLGVRRIVE